MVPANQRSTARERTLLSVDEVASRLKCHPHTVRRWVWGGKLAAVKVGDLIRIPVEELEKFIQPASKSKVAGRQARPASRKKGIRALLETMRKLRRSVKSTYVEEMERRMAEAEQPAEWSQPLG